MKEKMEPKTGTGVIVARFQVDELHPKHCKLIEYVSERSARILVLLGVSPTLGTAENPLDYETRAHMVLDAYPEVTVLPLPDAGNDEKWSQQLDAAIRVISPIGSVTLYGGRDSFVGHYRGRFRAIELGEEVFGVDDGVSGTACRVQVAEQPPLSTADFRRGAIYTAQRQYPKVFSTVDVAVTAYRDTKVHILLGRKPSESLWCFPGGFSDPSDLSFEVSAARELKEETALELSPSRLNYIGSRRQEDPRYAGRDRIITTFFGVHVEEHEAETAIAGDDLSELRWFVLESNLEEKIMPIHRALFSLLPLP